MEEELKKVLQELVKSSSPQSTALKQKVSVDVRKAKMKELKATIEKARKEQVDLLTGIDLDKEKVLTEEEQKANKEELGKKNALLHATIQANSEELKLTRINKNLSNAFSWEPHKGMNRQQARNFRKQRRLKA